MYIAALIRCQEIHRIGDIFNGAISIERRQFVIGALESFRLPKAFGHVGPHHARRDEVRADALRTVISDNRLRQADERGLHRAVAATTHAGKDRSEEHTSELQSLMRISYAVFCLKK